MSSSNIDSSFDDAFDGSLEDQPSDIGKSSQEATPQIGDKGTKKKFDLKEMLGNFSLFDAMLLVSLICVTLATLRLFFAFTQYGGYIWSYPWQVNP